MQLGHHVARQHEGVKVRLAHAARHLIEHGRQACPVVQESQKLPGPRMLGLVHGVKREGREFKIELLHAEAEAQRRVHRVAHVQVVRPAFGPVFPRVRAGVGADEVQRPVGRRAFFVVALERCRVVGGFVAKKLVKPFHPGRAGHQAVPVVMSHLMPEMPQQRAVRLVHRLAHGFALGIVGFVDVQGDEAGIVPGHDMRAVDRRA